MGPIWGRQDPGGPHVGPMNLAIWVSLIHGCEYLLKTFEFSSPWSTFLRRYSLMYHLKISYNFCLTHGDRVTHICVSKITIIGSDDGLLPGEVTIWINVVLSIRHLGTNVNEIVIKIPFSYKKMNFTKLSAKWWPFCLGINVLNFIDVWSCGTYCTILCYSQTFRRELHV